ncbi:unnamed protein product [Leuciscus chuanchicus]
MAPVVQLGLHHIRPFQWWIISQGISPHCHTCRRVLIKRIFTPCIRGRDSRFFAEESSMGRIVVPKLSRQTHPSQAGVQSIKDARPLQSGPTFKAGVGARRVEAGFVCFEYDNTLPALVFPDSRVAQDQTFCLPTDSLLSAVLLRSMAETPKALIWMTHLHLSGATVPWCARQIAVTS